MSRRKRVRKLPLVLVVVLLAIIVYSALGVLRPLPAIAAQKVLTVTPNTSAPVSLPWPNYGQAAVGAVGYGVLTRHGAQTPVATASLAKIMTALAVLQKHPLVAGQQGPTITITKADQAIYDYYYVRDGSLAAQKVGEKITEYQALEAMLLPSANNFADVLAIWAYGSMSNYTNFANHYAKTLGMDDSHFVDGSGFSPQTVSTAQDLVNLGETAIQNPVIADIVGQKTAKVPVAGTIDNVNWLLGTSGIIGLKTGNNNQDLGAFLSAMRYTTGGQTITLVSAVMKAPNLPSALDDSLPLLTATKTHLQKTTLIKQGQTIAHYDIPWSVTVAATASQNITAISWQDQITTSVVSLTPLKNFPVKTGATVGTIATSLPGTSTVDIQLKQNIPKPSWFWRIIHNH